MVRKSNITITVNHQVQNNARFHPETESPNYEGSGLGDTNRSKCNEPVWSWKMNAWIVLVVLCLTWTGSPHISEAAVKSSQKENLFGPNVLPSDSDVSKEDSAVLEKALDRDKNDKTVKRSVYVKVNHTVLQGNDPIWLNLFTNTFYKGTLTRFERRGWDSFTWVGKITGEKNSSIILVVERGVLAGHIWLKGQTFSIEYIGNDFHAIRQVYDAGFPVIANPLTVKDKPKFGTLKLGLERDDKAVDVVVFYTQNVLDVHGSSTAAVHAEALEAVEKTNEAYANSGIVQRMRLADAVLLTDYQPRTGFHDMLQEVSDLTNMMLDQNQPTSVRWWRDALGADIVSLWIESGGICGRANQMLPQLVNRYFESKAVHVVRRDCVEREFTLAHEAGHNMGAAHDRNDRYAQGAFNYSHAHVDDEQDWYTIMGSQGANIGKDRKLHFSNPTVNYMGKPTGIADFADNAKTLNETRPIVARFRSTPPLVTTPQPGTIIGCGPVTFQADTQINTTYVWAMGREPRYGDLFYQDTGTSPSVQANIPSTMHNRTLYVTLQTYIANPPVRTTHYRVFVYPVRC